MLLWISEKGQICLFFTKMILRKDWVPDKNKAQINVWTVFLENSKFTAFLTASPCLQVQIFLSLQWLQRHVFTRSNHLSRDVTYARWCLEVMACCHAECCHAMAEVPVFASLSFLLVWWSVASKYTLWYSPQSLVSALAFSSEPTSFTESYQYSSLLGRSPGNRFLSFFLAGSKKASWSKNDETLDLRIACAAFTAKKNALFTIVPKLNTNFLTAGLRNAILASQAYIDRLSRDRKESP